MDSLRRKAAVVVLIRWEAAADGGFDYTFVAPPENDTADRQCLPAPPASLFLSLMLPRKGQPFPLERRNCGHTFQGVLQFRLPSAPQRYNTLDFPTEVATKPPVSLDSSGQRGTLSPLNTPDKGERCSLLESPCQ